jgi:hypothetical protein
MEENNCWQASGEKKQVLGFRLSAVSGEDFAVKLVHCFASSFFFFGFQECVYAGSNESCP